MAKRILVVEDEAPIREMLCFVLEQKGYETVEAEDYADGLAKVREPYPELIVLDWMMPGGSGIQFIKQLKQDEVTRLIIDGHDAGAFAPVAGLSVGEFRDWLLSDAADTASLAALAPGLTPEMVAAVSKLMRNQDLILAAAKCQVVTRFRNTLGLPGRLAVRLQPNHPTDDPRGIAASMLDGLLYGSGDAVIGINPASDSTAVLGSLVKMLAEVIERYEIPTQSCVLTHVTNTMRMIEAGVPVDLVFQSVAGTEQANKGFGIKVFTLFFVSPVIFIIAILLGQLFFNRFICRFFVRREFNNGFWASIAVTSFIIHHAFP